MREPSIEDVDTLHSLIDPVHTALCLGYHTTGDCSVRYEVLCLRDRKATDDGVRIILIHQYPLYIGEEDKLLGLQGTGNRTRSVIGVDIVGIPLRIGSHGGRPPEQNHSSSER